MLYEGCQPILPDALHYHDGLLLPMLHTVYDLETEVRVPTHGKMSAKWSTLVLDLPPVARVSLVHGFGRLSCVLG